MAVAEPPRYARAIVIAAFGVALLLVVRLQLLAALLAALASHSIFVGMHRRLAPRIAPTHAGIAAVVLTLVTLGVIGFGIVQAVALLRRPGEGLGHLLQSMADALEQLRARLPEGIVGSLPASAEELRHDVTHWLRAHSRDLQRWGQDALRIFAYSLVGLAIGLMVAFSRHAPPRSYWAALVRERLARFETAFVAVVASQVRIAAANTVFTGAFLLIALPLAGIEMPMGRTLVALTFLAGLIPIIGNLLSNAAIVLVGLSVSPGLGLACLVFLMAIHKFEYFLNAHFVGRRTQVAPATLLVALLLGEAAFGIAGVLAAPIVAAWLVRELKDADVI